MKKNFLWSMLTILMVTVLGGGMMSCSDDPEPAPWQWSDGDGPIHLKSVSRTSDNDTETLCTYSYDSDHKLTKVAGMDVKWADDNSKFTLTKTNNDGSTYNYKIELTGRGLISTVDLQWKKIGENNKEENWNCKISCQYNVDKQLVSMVKDATHIDGHTNSVSKYTGTYNYTWANGVLTSCEFKISGDNPSTKKLTIDSHTIDQMNNSTLQFPYYIASIAIDEKEEEEHLSVGFLAAVGLFGVGPAYLPSKITYNNEDCLPFYEKDKNNRIIEERVNDLIYKYAY